MNTYQQKMYDDLLFLSDENDSFFYTDHELDGVTYRIFAYRLASYGDFCLPNALESRGNMFLMDGDNPIALVSHAMSKFFNLNENPFTENINMKDVKNIMEKRDGSLISTFIHNGELKLKTKNSLSSDQAIAAMKWLEEKDQIDLYNFLEVMALKDFTINMEWTSPNNRIVLSYQNHTLTILNIRDNTDDSYFQKEWLFDNSVGHDYWVDEVQISDKDRDQFIADIPNMEDIEGFVLILDTDQRIKIKTAWYLIRHRAKDSINAPRRLFEAIIGEAVDDVKGLFYGDESALKIISDMEKLVIPQYNSMVKQAEDYHRENKELERKEYAIKGTALNDGLMHLYMLKFDNREPDYKAFAIKNHERFIGKVKKDD